MDEEAGLHNNKASEITLLTCGLFAKTHLLGQCAACLDRIFGTTFQSMRFIMQGIVPFLFVFVRFFGCLLHSASHLHYRIIYSIFCAIGDANYRDHSWPWHQREMLEFTFFLFPAFQRLHSIHEEITSQSKISTNSEKESHFLIPFF